MTDVGKNTRGRSNARAKCIIDGRSLGSIDVQRDLGVRVHNCQKMIYKCKDRNESIRNVWGFIKVAKSYYSCVKLLAHIWSIMAITRRILRLWRECARDSLQNVD